MLQIGAHISIRKDEMQIPSTQEIGSSVSPLEATESRQQEASEVPYSGLCKDGRDDIA